MNVLPARNIESSTVVSVADHFHHNRPHPQPSSLIEPVPTATHRKWKASKSLMGRNLFATIGSTSNEESNSASEVVSRSSQDRSVSLRPHLIMRKLPDFQFPDLDGFPSVYVKKGLIQDVDRLVNSLGNSVLYIRLVGPKYLSEDIAKTCPVCHTTGRWTILTHVRHHMKRYCSYKKFILVEAGVPDKTTRGTARSGTRAWKVPIKYAESLIKSDQIEDNEDEVLKTE
jgi:hypothetical protein